MIVISCIYFILPWEAILDEYFEVKSVKNENQKTYE